MYDFSTPLSITLYFSKRLAGVVILLHTGALILLMPLTFPSIVQGFILKLSIALLIIASVIHVFRYYVLLRGHPLHRCQLHYDEIFLSHVKTPAQLLPDSFAHPQLVILRARLPNRQVSSLIIFPDALDETTFRHLRIYIKHPASLKR